MAYIQTSMLNGSGDFKVENPGTGTAYALNLKSGQIDTTGTPSDSDWVAVDMHAPEKLAGKVLASPEALGNTATPIERSHPTPLPLAGQYRG